MRYAETSRRLGKWQRNSQHLKTDRAQPTPIRGGETAKTHLGCQLLQRARSQVLANPLGTQAFPANPSEALRYWDEPANYIL